MPKFEILEHKADLKIRAFGKTEEELFLDMLLGMNSALRAQIQKSGDEKREIKDMYINGVPEPIVSKLAVEPIMRTYILSLISSEFIKTDTELEEFFKETFLHPKND